ncbi:MAG: zinc ribbon domain-containing protein [Dehalococcoidia bacterium]|nr:zinc ribbon domain-containing protein [Dehalococcoidia bacterium]
MPRLLMENLEAVRNSVMPIYEFRCQDCRRKATIFVRSVSSPIDTRCPSCGSGELVRLVSSFGISRSVKSVHERSGATGMYGNPDYYNDPRNIGRGVEDKFAQMGMEMPSEIRGMIDAAREGDLPDSVKDLQPNVKEL